MAPWNIENAVGNIMFRFHFKLWGCTYIYHENERNVGKYTYRKYTMDPMEFKSNLMTANHHPRRYLSTWLRWGCLIRNGVLLGVVVALKKHRDP